MMERCHGCLEEVVQTPHPTSGICFPNQQLNCPVHLGLLFLKDDILVI